MNYKNLHITYCEYCNAPMSESDVEDFGTLCERCYYKEYYNDDNAPY